MEFVDDLLEAVCGYFLAMGPEEMQLDAPFAQWHVQIRIATMDTSPIG